MLRRADVLDQLGRGKPFRESQADNSSAASLDHIPPDDRIGSPIGSLDEDVRLNAGHNRMRGLLVEDRDRIDAAQCLQYFGPLSFGVDRTLRSLVRTHGSIGVDRDDQRISQGARLPEISDVPGMEQIEHAIGKDDSATAPTDMFGKSGSVLV